MATSFNKAVTRVTVYPHRGRALMVTLGPGDLITIRQKGLRTSYDLPAGAAYDVAVKMKAAADRAEKRKHKKGGKR